MSALVERCPLTQGDRVDGRYVVSKTIGDGAFGTVYLVRDSSGIKRALKLLRLWDVHPEIRGGLVKRFDMEFETGLIDSHYLVHSIDHGLMKGNPYIVMEYCSQGDVQHLFNEGGVDVDKVAAHTLHGLRDLHKHGKVHRDLKPENVLLKDSGIFALTDFGISGDRNKRMTERNIVGRPRQIFGTYAYMPPEQLNPRRDATVLPTTDIFSFGVMMYQLLAGGNLPFGELSNETDLVQYVKRGKNGDWDRRTIVQNGCQDWIPLLDGCLQPNFEKRLQSCDEAFSYLPHKNVVNVYHVEKQDDYECPTKIVNGVLLQVMQGEEYGRYYLLDDMLRGYNNRLTLGRKDPSVDNDVEIKEENSAYISRHQCTFELDYSRGCWIVYDGQQASGGWRPSRNGTFVNSRPVGRKGLPFNPGDIISIGEVKLRAEAY